MAKDKEQKKTFVIYEDMMNIVLSLPDDAALDFVRTLFSHFLQKDYDATPISAGLLESFKERIDTDHERYEAVCEERRKAASKGGKQRAENERQRKQNEANASKCYQMQANANVCFENSSKVKQNQRDNDNDNEYDNGNDNDNVFSSKRKKMCSKEHIKEIVDTWNDAFAFSDVPKVTIVKTGSKREKMLHARIDEFGKDKVLDAIRLAAASAFLKSSSWFSFDWLICPNNFVKVIEGNYQDHVKPAAATQKNSAAEDLDDFYRRAVAWAEGE